MRAPSNLLAAVLLVPSFVGGACLSQNEIVEGTLTKSLFASPADGTSGLDSLQVGLGVSPPRPDDDVDRVVMGTTLATWPDLGPIEASRIPATPTGLPPEITATTPVPEGWYAAILPSLPPSLAPSSTSIYRLSDGRHVVAA